MARVLFVSNGHGEMSIAQRIAQEASLRSAATLEHLPLVGTGKGAERNLVTVGPRVSMPSGGLVAMGNLRAFVRDLHAGFARLFAAQLRFLRTQGKDYACIVAVGDAYALALALFAGRPTLYVGTAKSVYVAGYGAFERVLLRQARRVFVRDEPTAAALRAQGVPAEAPGNVIVDLLDKEDLDTVPDSSPVREERIGILPGSRVTAYDDGIYLARVIRAMSASALFSIAPALEASKFERCLIADGWVVTPIVGNPKVPFEAHDGAGAHLTAWTGSLGTFLRASRLVLGQAGTANEAAAACGIPVVALETNKGGWYRMRQQRLLGEALAIVPSEPTTAARALQALADDKPRLEFMRSMGRERMGKPGAACVIAGVIAEFCS